MGINGLEVPRWDRDGLLWQACSTDDCSSSNRGNRDCAEEERELNDSHADCHTGGREIINPESDDGGKSNSECNRNSSSSSSSCVTDMIIGTDTDLIECVEVPDPSTINSCPDIPCIEMRVMDTALTEFSSDERQTLDFNVIREERYVRAFRLEFMSRSNEMDAREVDEAFLYSLMSAGGDKNRGDVKKENFCTRNNQMFYSLMECLASKPLMCLPLQSLLPVLLVPTGRGVCRDGAVIFMPSKDDYLEFVYYHEKRAESSLSSSRQANKRLGEWRGVDSNIPKDLQDARKEESLNTCTRCDVSDHDPMCEASSPGSGGRGLIGYVTSGRYCGSPCGSVSYGFCDATLLQEMAISAAKLLLEYQGVGTAGSRSPPRGRVLSLVMFRSPRSRWLRPALVDIISILQ